MCKNRNRLCSSPRENERKLLHQISSGCGTQQNDSKDEPTYVDSFDMPSTSPAIVALSPAIAHDHDTEMIVLNADGLTNVSIMSPPNDNDQRKRAKFRSPINEHDVKSNISVIDSYSCTSPTSKSEVTKGTCHNMRRLASDQSINSLTNEPDDEITQPNLRDELLSCEHKELFQFLNDDFENSHNYFSDTVGYGSAMIDPDTESLIIDSKRDNYTPTRKGSTISNKSNLSNISNSIFEALEKNRGGSISETVDLRQKAADTAIRMPSTQIESFQRCDDLEPLVQDSEFENIIASFEKELNIIKNSTGSLQRHFANVSRQSNDERPKAHSFEKSSSTHTYEEILPLRLSHSNNSNRNSNRNSVKLKRRSLEKQMRVEDDFNVSHEVKKICDHMQAPFLGSCGGATSSAASSRDIDSVSSKAGPSPSPRMQRINDFHIDLDRMKRTNQRVDEMLSDDISMTIQNSSNGEHPTTTVKINTEKLPRKYLNADMNIESLSLRSTGSYEQLVCHTQNEKEQKKIRFEKCSDENVRSEQTHSTSKSNAMDPSAQNMEKGMKIGCIFSSTFFDFFYDLILTI